MRYLLLAAFAAFILLASCGQKQVKTETAEEVALPSTGAFGEEFDATEALNSSALSSSFIDSDSVELIIAGAITASCKHSGCWMDLDMGNGEAIHVTFLDEAFAIPLDAAGKNAVAKGIAIREMIPVETLQNFARDEGKSEEEVLAITEPEWKYSFVSSGVIITE